VIRFRHNPGLFDDDDESESSVLGELLNEETSFDEEFRAIEAEADREKSEQRRVEAARAIGGVSPSALALAESGLRGALSGAQKLYAELGAKLDQPALGRQARRDLRDARRVLEEAWGVNALRIEARPSKQRRFTTPEILAKTVRMSLGELPEVKASGVLSVTEPLDADEPMVTLQAVASFGRKYVPRGRGLMGQETKLKGVYYGIDAQDQADRDYAQMLIDEGIKLEARSKKLKAAGVPSDNETRRRVEYKINENKKQKEKLVARRLATAEELKKLLG